MPVQPPAQHATAATPPAQKKPAGQASHADAFVDPASAVVPGAHGVHAAAPPADQVPAAHGSHAAAAEAVPENEPAAHGVGVAVVPVQKEPRVHGAHVNAVPYGTR